MCVSNQGYRLDVGNGAALAGLTDSVPEKERLKRGVPGTLYCSACGHPITDASQRTRVQGSHEHDCINPAQITFHIGCFVSAAGCAAAGRFTAEHSWFPGYRWRYALCAACGEHLGWEFSGIGGFFGLVLDRLKTGK